MVKSKKTIKSQLLTTLLVIVLFRLGSGIAIPGISSTIAKLLKADVAHSNALSLFSIFTGGALAKISILALGISPFVTSKIVVQLAGRIFPSLSAGRANDITSEKKISLTARWLTVPIAFAQSFGLADYFHYIHALSNPLATSLFWTFGAIVCMWLSEIIDSKGVGNGPSLLIMLGILGAVPAAIITDYRSHQTLFVSFSLVFIGIMIIAIIILDRLMVKVPVIYPKVITSKLAEKNYFPIKYSTGGIMPAIFASMFLSIPGTISSFFTSNHLPGASLVLKLADPTYLGTIAVTFMLIIAFGWLFSITSFDADDFSASLGMSGGYIRSKRVGADTANFIEKLYKKISWEGTFMLALFTVFPATLTALHILYNTGISPITILLIGTVLSDQVTRWTGAYKVYREASGGWVTKVLSEPVVLKKHTTQTIQEQ